MSGDTGIVKSVISLVDEEGRSVLRAIVDYYDGDSPTFAFKVVWERRPVKIIEAGDANL